MSDPVEAPSPFRWTWAVIGVLGGAVLISTSFAIVRDVPPRPDVAILLAALTFVLMGILVGYRSPGETLAEPTVAGLVLALLGLAALVVLGYPVGRVIFLAGVPLGVLLSLVGAWVGEVLQGTVQGESAGEGLQWPWILVGTVLGVLLNNYAVFVLHALFDLQALGILIAFVASFVVAGFFVGYFSPGVTILEPAIAGLLMIAADVLFTVVLFGAPFPLGAIAVGAVIAFLTALFGGWLGELAQGRFRRPQPA